MEIKYRYTITKPNKPAVSEIFTLKQIENGEALKWIHQYNPREMDIVKEQFINRWDVKGIELYVGDMIERRCEEDDTSDDGYKKGDLMYTAAIIYSTYACAFIQRKGLDFRIMSKMHLTKIGTIRDTETLE